MGSLNYGSRDTMIYIIDQTALESAESELLRGNIIEFISKAESDEAKRRFLIDKATLHWLHKALQDLRKKICNQSLLQSMLSLQTKSQ